MSEIYCGYCKEPQGHGDVYKMIAEGCRRCGAKPEFEEEKKNKSF